MELNLLLIAGITVFVVTMQHFSNRRHEGHIMRLALESMAHLNARSTTEKVQADVYQKQSELAIADIGKTLDKSTVSNVVPEVDKIIKDKYGYEYDLVGYEGVSDLGKRDAQ